MELRAVATTDEQKAEAANMRVLCSIGVGSAGTLYLLMPDVAGKAAAYTVLPLDATVKDIVFNVHRNSAGALQ